MLLLGGCSNNNASASPTISSNGENSSFDTHTADNAAATAPFADNSPPDDVGSSNTDQAGIPILKTILTEVGQSDGKSITDFTLSAPCISKITTMDSTKTVNWSKVQDWAARDENERTIIELNDGHETSVVSVPTKPQPEPMGNAFARVEGGFIVLAETCSKKP
ncbi:hypothetical protein [Sphingomonas sp. PP-CE-1G-424]|uniref:hypothetical protein n=1 Tax=Sphingomonas sp. PP-CE-1G-424 TaxID=2135658 RepID=UPI0010567A84|nr:hypothetical protein [Sphingomonas sp. PP-CE-1G-424]